MLEGDIGECCCCGIGIAKGTKHFKIFDEYNHFQLFCVDCNNKKKEVNYK